MSARDTSGLWDKSQVGTPDRTVPIAPPPRQKRQPSTVEHEPAPLTSVPTPQVDEAPDATATDTAEPKVDATAVLLALAFTSEQMDWIRKASARRNQWAGEFFEELFYKHKTAVISAGVGPRTRRRSSNYTGTRVKVSAAAFDDFATATSDLATSRAALGRAIIEAERNPTN